MADRKPLPDLPNFKIAELSVEARRHRSRLILQALSEAQESGIAGRREEWVEVFEKVLDDFSRELVERDWLHAIKLVEENREQYPQQDTETSKEFTKGDARERSSSNRSLLSSSVLANAVLPSPTTRPISDEVKQQTLDYLRVLSVEPPTKITSPSGRQLLLCVAPFDTQKSSPYEDGVFAFVPTKVSCAFSSGHYVLPSSESAHPQDTILYGLREWSNILVSGSKDHVGLIGGTFTFKEVISLRQHQLLCRVLHFSLYIHLSLLLEQQVLLDSGVHLVIQRPKIPPPSVSVPITSPETGHIVDEHQPRKHRHSFLSGGILSFFTKRNLGKPSPDPHTRNRRGSLDSISGEPTDLKRQTSRGSFDGIVSQPLSFLDRRLSFLRPNQSKEVEESPYAEALRNIRASEDLYSTSLGTTIRPPRLLVSIVDRERDHAQRKLDGDEKAGLASLLGWENNESKGKGMSKTAGFVRQQGISVLFALFVPKMPASYQASETPSTTASRTSAHSLPLQFMACTQPLWLTYYFYSFSSGQDFRLGQVIHHLASAVSSTCTTPGCQIPLSEHELHFIHAGLRIVVGFNSADPSDAETSDRLQMWESCAICGAATTKTTMSDGTYLFSFAKYLELVLYSSAFCKLRTHICGHTTPPPGPGPWTGPPPSQLNIIRHFMVKDKIINFNLSLSSEVFEVRVPRLQMTRYADKPEFNTLTTENIQNDPDAEERRQLRREIKKWWEGIADHIDELEKHLQKDDESFVHKALPRLPSTDDAYEDLVIDSPTTPKRGGSAPLPATPPLESAYFDRTVAPPVPAPSPNLPAQLEMTIPSTVPSTPAALDRPAEDSLILLSRLRQYFQTSEKSLYDMIVRGQRPLHEIKKDFLAFGRGAQSRLIAWQKKHVPALRKSHFGIDLASHEPSWWAKGCHLFPGADFIVREDDWGSIIAYTMSTHEYRLELQEMMAAPRSGTASPRLPSTPGTASSSAFSANSATTGFKFFSAPSSHVLDPDQDSPAWNEQDAYSSTICRKDYIKETGILSLRGVLGSKSAVDVSSAALANALGNVPPSRLAAMTPPSAWTKPEVQLSIEPVTGLVTGLSSAEIVGKMLHHIEHTSTSSGDTIRSDSVGFGSILEDIEPAEEHMVDQAKTRTPSVASVASTKSSAASTIGKASVAGSVLAAVPPDLPPKDSSAIKGHLSQDNLVKTTFLEDRPPKEPSSTDGSILAYPPVPPKDAHPPSHQTEGSSSTLSSSTQSHVPSNLSRADQSSGPKLPPKTNSAMSSVLTNTLTSSLNYAMRLVMNDGAGSRPMSPMGGPGAPSPLGLRHHALLSSDFPGVRDRPHIKYDWTVGKKMKFSCTVYFAADFHKLRRRCGIEDTFLKSLSCSANWTADGGKSRSNFWKTGDDKFIIKTLVNAWNVADLQNLIEMAPSYFSYLYTTASKPTVLAKVVGFYTIEIRNLETGNVHSKADLLVMENLFYGRNISKTFDLKGIQGRKVKVPAGARGSTTTAAAAAAPTSKTIVTPAEVDFYGDETKTIDTETEAEKGTIKSTAKDEETKKKITLPRPPQPMGKTLFDGEWIEEQQKGLMLIQPYSKAVLREALRNDAEFLARCNIMDYSLLLGVDEEKKQIACGLVDTIGSYTFAKTLEHKAKQNFKSGKEITVIPPAEYQERFVAALEKYFLACPDKWSKPQGEYQGYTDISMLPCPL